MSRVLKMNCLIPPQLREGSSHLKGLSPRCGCFLLPSTKKTAPSRIVSGCFGNASDSGKWRCHSKHKEQKEAERFQLTRTLTYEYDSKKILQQNLLCSIHLWKLPWQWKNNHVWRCMLYCCHVTLRDTSKPTYHSLPPLLPRSGLYLANLTRPKEPHPKVRTLGCTNFSPQPFWPKNQLEVGLVSSTYRAEAFAQFPSVDLLMGWLFKALDII